MGIYGCGHQEVGVVRINVYKLYIIYIYNYVGVVSGCCKEVLL